jgi:hypothetical protein
MKDVLDVFGDLPDFPGKRTPKNRPETKLTSKNMDDPFAGVPFKKLSVNGEVSIYYTVGNMATILGRKAQTLRKWEKKGWIPPATYRTTKYSGSDLLNTTQRGYRLYSREQVEIIRNALELYELTGTRTSSWQNADNWNKFIKHVKNNWKK